MKKKVFVSLFLIIALAAMTIPASANGTIDTEVTYYECVELVSVDKTWFPDGNLRMMNARYVSEITSTDPRFDGGTLYGNEKVVIGRKSGEDLWQGTARIELPGDGGVWEGTWTGSGELGQYWQINIVFQGKEGDVKGLKAFITTQSLENNYFCAESTGIIVNPGG